MARKKVGKIDTETLLIIGAVAVVGIYFLTRTTVAPVNPYASNYISTPGGGGYLLPGNTTAQDIQAGAGGAASIISSLSNAGIFG
jgi:hypothetical protein